MEPRAAGLHRETEGPMDRQIEGQVIWAGVQLGREFAEMGAALPCILVVRAVFHLNR